MEYLVYKSLALVAPGSAECRDIVKVSQATNARLGLTGFLHAEKRLFVQYLEGASEPLWTLYERLFDDPRHTDIVLLGHGELNRHRFEDWSMGYSDINVLSFKDFLGEVSFMSREGEPFGIAAIIFLMSASTRIGLGIVDSPQSSWH